MTSATEDRPVVLITARSFGSGRHDLRADLEAAGCRVVNGPADHDPDTLGAALGRAQAWIAGTGPITQAHLDLAPQLRIIARYGIGVDAVDLAAAGRRAITVTNTPGANSESVADHTLALMLAGLRRITVGDRDVRGGRWHALQTRELGGLSVGLIGYGRIGQAVARRLRGFGSTVLAVDPGMADHTIAQAGAEPVALPELVLRADIVSLHAPGGATVVDAAFFSDSAELLVLVNTARADLVDEHAVADALRSGQLDVFAADTLSSETGGAGGEDRIVSVLADPQLADQVVLTPHRAAQTREAVDRMGLAATEAVLDLLAGRTPRHRVSPPAPDQPPRGQPPPDQPPSEQPPSEQPSREDT